MADKLITPADAIKIVNNGKISEAAEAAYTIYSRFDLGMVTSDDVLKVAQAVEERKKQEIQKMKTK